MIQGCRCGVYLLPVCFTIIMFVSLGISFTIAVLDSDINPWFPAISDTATKSPESNIFGQLVNIASFIGFMLVYVRYLQVKHDVDWMHRNRTTIILNRWGLFFGLIAIFGSSIVANFPETQVTEVHIIGSFVLFVSGNIYAWIQAVISLYMKIFGLISSCICSVRFTLSLVSTVSFIISMIMMGYAGRKWPGNHLKWHSYNPGYKEHVVGDAFEWLMVFSFIGLFLTFTKEFWRNKLEIKLVGYHYFEPVPVVPRDIEIV